MEIEKFIRESSVRGGVISVIRSRYVCRKAELIDGKRELYERVSTNHYEGRGRRGEGIKTKDESSRNIRVRVPRKFVIRSRKHRYRLNAGHG